MEETITEHEAFLRMLREHDMNGLENMVEHHLTTAQNINLKLLES